MNSLNYPACETCPKNRWQQASISDVVREAVDSRFDWDAAESADDLEGERLHEPSAEIMSVIGNISPLSDEGRYLGAASMCGYRIGADRCGVLSYDIDTHQIVERSAEE
ncbi:MAG: hypothetical protein M3Q14_02780 [bacterium]|nr:hypothetical protein [bacterium]